MASWNVMLTLIQNEDEASLTDGGMQALVGALDCAAVGKSGEGIPREFTCTVQVEAEDQAAAEQFAKTQAHGRLLGSGIGGWAVAESVNVEPSAES